MYIVGGIILYKMLDPSKIDLQYLSAYRRAANELINCVPSSCTQSDLKDGLHYYMHWVHLFPKSMESHNAAGYCYYHLGEYRRALEYFNQAVKLDPKNSILYYNQALALLRLGEYSKALEALKTGSNFFAPATFLNNDVILPFKKNLPPDVAGQPVVIYNFSLYAYGGLMSLTQQIVDSTDNQKKEELVGKLYQEMDAVELYYYIPFYKTSNQGREIIMI